MIRIMRHHGARPWGVWLLATLVITSVLGGRSIAQPAVSRAAPATASAPASGQGTALGPPIVRVAGSTAALVIASGTSVPSSLLTPATLQALGVQFHNTVGSAAARHVAPLPVLLVGTRAVPTVKAALAQVKRLQPVRLYLLGMTHDIRLTIVTNTLFDGLSVYINKTPGQIASTSGLVRAIGGAVQFTPIIVGHGTGVKLANAAQVDASTAVTPPGGPIPSAYELPAVDLPPVGDQGQEGSCTAWSTSYYYKTFQEAKKHHWSASDPSHIFSPSFIYNQINGGKDDGSAIPDAMQLITQEGDVPISLFPYIDGDYLRQPSTQVIADGAPYHAADFGYLYDGEQQSGPPDLSAIKHWLASGDGVVISAELWGPSFDNYTGGVYDGPYTGDKDEGGHAMFVVGYDDNVDGTGYGALRIINSWSTQWGDNGYVWLGYDYLMQNLQEAWVMLDTPATPGPTATPAPVAPTNTPLPRPTAIPAPPAPVRTYKASGRYTLTPHPSKKDFIANLFFAFTAKDQHGRTIEADKPVYHVEVGADSDTVFTLHYVMGAGAKVTAQIEVQAGDYPG